MFPIYEEEPITGLIVVHEPTGATSEQEASVWIDPRRLEKHGIDVDARGFPTAKSMADYHYRVNGIEP